MSTSPAWPSTNDQDAGQRGRCPAESTLRRPSGLEPDALVDEYFEPEHLASLKDEEGAITEAPDEASLAYIHRLVSLATEHRLELDELVRQHLPRLEARAYHAHGHGRAALCADGDNLP